MEAWAIASTILISGVGLGIAARLIWQVGKWGTEGGTTSSRRGPPRLPEECPTTYAEHRTPIGIAARGCTCGPAPEDYWVFPANLKFATMTAGHFLRR